jgi:hypothetical protein
VSVKRSEDGGVQLILRERAREPAIPILIDQELQLLSTNQGGVHVVALANPQGDLPLHTRSQMMEAQPQLRRRAAEDTRQDKGIFVIEAQFHRN